MTEPPTLDTAALCTLGSDLLAELSHAAGDEDAINAIFRRWLDVLDTPNLLMAATAALKEAFTACVVMVLPTDEETAA